MVHNKWLSLSDCGRNNPKPDVAVNSLSTIIGINSEKAETHSNPYKWKEIYTKISKTRKGCGGWPECPATPVSGLSFYLALTSLQNAFSWLDLPSCELWIQLYMNSPRTCSWSLDQVISCPKYIRVFWGECKINRSQVFPPTVDWCVESLEVDIAQSSWDPAVLGNPVITIFKHTNSWVLTSCDYSFRNIDRDPWCLILCG